MIHTPDGWQHKNINWEVLSGFGRSSVATLTMAAPFLGYIVLYHSSLSMYLGGLGGLIDGQSQANACHPWLTVEQKINLLYLGLLSLGWGSILFRVLAPSVVKRSSGIADYVDQELPRATARNMRSMFVTIRSRRPSLEEDFIERAPWLDRTRASLKVAADSLHQVKDDQLQIDILSSYYNVLSRHTARLAVYITVALYAVGFLLVSIPGFTTTIRVLCVMRF
ncbi:hypothetical protein FHT87_003945 [Rhizobium sp. BK316]|uniref:hypothetical protein n=1 Tax=Rhizobium sp. BK316 TaxID=2587053 RepID=UPI00161E9B57|nr:hypothetical protein [Rhizobium sp. BK316]MBB3410013.1 hypothetical protein [Rhizobium sp. BK316]